MKFTIISLALCLFTALSSSAEQKPNFVIIFTDDQGYGDLGCFGSPKIKTPHIDQMAKEGMKLTSFYVGGPVCTPSRASLMTGCYPPRVDMGTGSSIGVLVAGDSKGLNPNEITIAETLKQAGYITGMFGKWHLGDQPEFLPTNQGFDEFYGLPYSHDIHPFHTNNAKHNFPPLPMLDGEKVIELNPNADHLTKRFTEKAVDFIARHKDKPFFLYVPHPIPHRPLHVSEDFQDRIDPSIREKLEAENGKVDYPTRDKIYNTAVEEIDWSVGQILDALRKNDLDKKTIVIFTSDNGPSKGSAGPLRGKKGSIYEGGMREPTVIWAPDRIPAGTTNPQILTALDLLPTFTKLAGGTIPSDRVIDGKDIWQNLTNPTQSETPHEFFYYYSKNNLAAIRSGDWKLHIGKLRAKSPGSKLYNLKTDIGEKKNIAAKHPEEVARLLAQAKKFDAELKKNVRQAGHVDNPKALTK